MAQTSTKQSTTMTVRLSRDTKERLEKAAKHQNRSKSFLAAEAIENLLQMQEEQDAGIRAAMVSMDKHGGIPHEKVKQWVESWGTDNELPMPTV